MSANNPNRERMIGKGQRLKVTSATYLALGCEVAPMMRPIASLSSLAPQFGTNEKLLHYESMVALGKLVHAMRQQTPDWRHGV